MNPLPPNTDELVSAYLDGEATADEIALVESSPELLDQVEALRGLRRRINQVPAAPPEVKAAHIGAALSAFDDLFAESPGLQAVPDSPVADLASANALTTAPTESATESVTGEPQAPTVVSLGEARERRRRRFSPGLIAAIAATLLLVAVAALSFGRGGTTDSVASSAAPDAVADATEAAGGMSEMAPQDATASDTIESADSADAATMSAPELRSADGELDEDEAVGAQAMSDDAMAEDEDAMDDEAMSEDDAEEAVEESAGASDSDRNFDEAAEAESTDADAAEDSADAANSAESASSVDPLPFGTLGTFASEAELQQALDQLELADLQFDERRRLGLFAPGCQPSVDTLAQAPWITLVSEAAINDRLIEIHATEVEPSPDTPVEDLTLVALYADTCDFVFIE